MIILDNIAIGFGVAILGALALSLATKGEAATKMSLLLCGMWSYTKVAAYFFGWETARRIYPLGDVFAICFASFLWYLDAKQWKLGVMYAILTKLIVHVGYWRHGAATHHDAIDVYNYTLALNILTAVEVLCVYYAGGEAVGRLVRDRVSGGWSADRGVHASHRRGPPEA